MDVEYNSTMSDFFGTPPGSSVHGILQARILNGLPFPPAGDLPDQGSNLCLLHLLHWQLDSLPLAPPGKPITSEVLVEILCGKLLARKDARASVVCC